ncbi:MAG: T9SS type A sorting domain-containing protein, partial [Bacteroidota bacterium]
TLFYRYDTLLLARHCQNNVEEYFDTIQVNVQIFHPVGQTIYTDTTIANNDTLVMYYNVFAYDCGLHLLAEPTHAAFSYFSYELMDDTATYFYKSIDNWTGTDTVFLESVCVTGNGPDMYDTLALVIHVVQGTTGISNGSFPAPEIYPNPATQAIYIRFGPYYPEGLVIRLLSMEGVLLREGKNVRKMPTAGLKPGVYLLQLEYGGRRVVRKVLIGGD